MIIENLTNYLLHWIQKAPRPKGRGAAVPP